MGKKKSSKSDAEKKIALQAKKAAKAEKAALKRLLKSERKSTSSAIVGVDDDDDDDDDNESDVDNIAGGGNSSKTIENMDLILIERYIRKQQQQEEAKMKKMGVGDNKSATKMSLDGFPLPRSNATLTVVTDNNNSNSNSGGTKKKKNKNTVTAYLFGGEYFDGVQNVVLNELLELQLTTTAGAAKSSVVTEVTWKEIIVSKGQPQPPPRCAHSAVYYNRCLYVFGGEISSAIEDRYHHYKDVWKYHMDDQTWTEITNVKSIAAINSITSITATTGSNTSTNKTTSKKPTTSKRSNLSSMSSTATTALTALTALTDNTPSIPTPRSGHAGVLYKHFMIVFGGFYEVSKAGGDPKWYNDLYVMDLKTELWLHVPHSKLTARPEPRSRCNAAVLAADDKLLIHGGFSKLPKSGSAPVIPVLPNTFSQQSGPHLPPTPSSETKVHTDSWLLNLKPLLNGKPPTWERFTSSVPRTHWTLSAHQSPTGRCSTACVPLSVKTTTSSTTTTTNNTNNTNNNNNITTRILMLGGVVDKELHHHVVDSIFYNDLFVWDLSKRKFFPIQPSSSSKLHSCSKITKAQSKLQHKSSKPIKSKSQPSSSSKKQQALHESDDDDESDDDESDDDESDDDESSSHDNDSDVLLQQEQDTDITSPKNDDTLSTNNNSSNQGWDVNKLLMSNMLKSFVDGNGERIEPQQTRERIQQNTRCNLDNDDDDHNDHEEEEEEKEKAKEDDSHEHHDVRQVGNAKHPRKSAINVTKINSNTDYDTTDYTKQQQQPLPRIKASLFLSPNNRFLYVYGGLLEVGDREVTLDDMWCMDLKMKQWHCVYRGSMNRHVWRELKDDDDTTSTATQTGITGDDNDDESENSDNSNNSDNSYTDSGGRTTKTTTKISSTSIKEQQHVSHSKNRHKNDPGIENVNNRHIETKNSRQNNNKVKHVDEAIPKDTCNDTLLDISSDKDCRHNDDDCISSKKNNDSETNPPKKSSYKQRRSELRQQITNLVQQWNLDDNEKSPLPGESMMDYCTRTYSYWKQQASLANNGTAKNLDDDNDNDHITETNLQNYAHELSRQRYEELVPIMNQIEQLHIQMKLEKDKTNKK